MGDQHWTPVIIAHTAAAALALGIGGFLLWMPKGTVRHRLLGWVWVLLMSAVALLSFGIQRDGFSWIHALSAFTLIMLVVGVRHARKHEIKDHRRTMIGLYLGALIITGLFTLAPTRLIGRALFS